MIELVAPFGGQDEMILDLAKHVFPGEPFKFHQLGEGGAREVVTYSDHVETSH
jgi:cytolysin-activating lysine-acyltransferase